MLSPQRSPGVGALRVKVLPIAVGDVCAMRAGFSRLAAKWSGRSRGGRYSLFEYCSSNPGIYGAPRAQLFNKPRSNSSAPTGKRCRLRCKQSDLARVLVQKVRAASASNVFPTQMTEKPPINMEGCESHQQPPARQCVVSVVGLCQPNLGDDNVGVGKSSLCSRFVRPGFDDYLLYGEAHDICTALSKTGRSAEAVGELAGGNGRHQWLYFGSRTVECGNRKVPVNVHVVERTVINSERLSRPPSEEDYVAFATNLQLQRLPRGQQKTVYRSADQLDFDQTGGEAVPYFLFNRYIDGVIFALDLSQEPSVCRQQLQFLQACSSKLDGRTPLAVAIVKCDSLGVVRLALIEHGDFRSLFSDAEGKALASQLQNLPWFPLSARFGVGFDDPFSYIARQVHFEAMSQTREQLHQSITTRRPLSLVIMEQRDAIIAARREMRRLLRERVTDFSKQWCETRAELENEEGYTRLRALQGKDECLRFFQLRLLELRMTGEISAEDLLGNSRSKKDRRAQGASPSSQDAEQNDGIPDELIWGWCELICSHHGQMMVSWAEHPDLKPLLDRWFLTGISSPESPVNTATNKTVNCRDQELVPRETAEDMSVRHTASRSQKASVLTPSLSNAMCILPELASLGHLTGESQVGDMSSLSHYDVADGYRLLPMPSPGMPAIRHDYVDLDAVQAVLSGRIAQMAALVAEDRSKHLSQQQERKAQFRSSFGSNGARHSYVLTSASSGGSNESVFLDAYSSSLDNTSNSEQFRSPLTSAGSEEDDSLSFQRLSMSLPVELLSGYEVPAELRPNQSSTSTCNQSAKKFNTLSIVNNLSGVQSLGRKSTRRVGGRDRALAFSIGKKPNASSVATDKTENHTTDNNEHLPANVPSLPESPAYLIVPISGHVQPDSPADITEDSHAPEPSSQTTSSQKLPPTDKSSHSRSPNLLTSNTASIDRPALALPESTVHAVPLSGQSIQACRSMAVTESSLSGKQSTSLGNFVPAEKFAYSLSLIQAAKSKPLENESAPST